MEVKFKTNEAKEITLSLSEEETQVLVKYAIVSLIRQGVISFAESGIDTEYLANVATEQMGQA